MDNFELICIPSTGLQVVAANDLKAGDQLLINYGHRSDDELLLNYGFVLGLAQQIQHSFFTDGRGLPGTQSSSKFTHRSL